MTSPFDQVASGYDEVAGSNLGVVLRSRVHSVLGPHVRSGTRMLDLGCGSGIDAAWAHDRGAEVTAVDASGEMVAVTRSRLGPSADVRQLDLADPEWDVEGSYDVVLSNFGVVSCVPDLAAFGDRLRDVTRPGSVVVLVPMARIVPWELAAAAVHLDRRRLLLRFRRDPVFVDGYAGLSVRYRSGRDVARELGSGFRVTRLSALGWALPTYEHRRVVEGRPRLRAGLASLDRALARPAARFGVGDHHIVELVRR